jgi:hypothetical protein
VLLPHLNFSIPLSALLPLFLHVWRVTPTSLAPGARPSCRPGCGCTAAWLPLLDAPHPLAEALWGLLDVADTTDPLQAGAGADASTSLRALRLRARSLPCASCLLLQLLIHRRAAPAAPAPVLDAALRHQLVQLAAPPAAAGDSGAEEQLVAALARHPQHPPLRHKFGPWLSGAVSHALAAPPPPAAWLEDALAGRTPTTAAAASTPPAADTRALLASLRSASRGSLGAVHPGLDEALACLAAGGDHALAQPLLTCSCGGPDAPPVSPQYRAVARRLGQQRGAASL